MGRKGHPPQGRMARAVLLAPFLALLLPCAGAGAQVTHRDLEDLERHRREVRPAPILQSIGSDSLAWDVMVGVETWDFLEGGAPEEVPDTTSGSSHAPGRGAVIPVFWESPDTLLSAMVADYIVRHRNGLATVLGRFAAYEDELGRIFTLRGLPGDLAILAAVESAMNPLALSRAGARGMWQFMAGTARQYGLRCDGLVDERLDYTRSAEAAAAYLEKAFLRYGDWRLAISSYNCGPAAVDRAVARAGSDDYWDIYPYLPTETRGYFPAFAAFLYAYLYRDDLGIPLRGHRRERYVLYRVDDDTTFAEMASRFGVGVRELERLNPQFLAGIIPGKTRTYYLRIPADRLP